MGCAPTYVQQDETKLLENLLQSNPSEIRLRKAGIRGTLAKMYNYYIPFNPSNPQSPLIECKTSLDSYEPRAYQDLTVTLLSLLDIEKPREVRIIKSVQPSYQIYIKRE